MRRRKWEEEKEEKDDSEKEEEQTVVEEDRADGARRAGTDTLSNLNRRRGDGERGGLLEERGRVIVKLQLICTSVVFSFFFLSLKTISDNRECIGDNGDLGYKSRW